MRNTNALDRVSFEHLPRRLSFRAFSAFLSKELSLGRCPRLLHSAPWALRSKATLDQASLSLSDWQGRTYSLNEKRSPAEVSGAINVAVQEAADAIANQPLSRDDKEAVKEFIQGLGNQKKP